jgi:hypothetical protein
MVCRGISAERVFLRWLRKDLEGRIEFDDDADRAAAELVSLAVATRFADGGEEEEKWSAW